MGLKCPGKNTNPTIKWTRGSGITEFRCRALLFDIDGTLVDSLPAVDRAWTEWARRHEMDPNEVSRANSRPAFYRFDQTAEARSGRRGGKPLAPQRGSERHGWRHRHCGRSRICRAACRRHVCRCHLWDKRRGPRAAHRGWDRYSPCGGLWRGRSERKAAPRPIPSGRISARSRSNRLRRLRRHPGWSSIGQSGWDEGGGSCDLAELRRSKGSRRDRSQFSPC